MIDLLLLQRFAIALALGALIGLEREYARYRKRGHDFAGIRTFPLITLLGALTAYFADTISPYILIVGLSLIGLLVIIAYIIISKKDRTHVGATSEVAALLTFFIGMLAYYEEFFFAIILTVTIAVILYARSILHHFAERITQKEMASTLVFAIIAFLILPLLPNQGYGPLELFNPYLTWLMVVLISGISFAGYVLMKWFGEQGIPLTGILGGLVSSTATTTSFSQRSRKEPKIHHALALGVILSNGIMFVRVLVLAFIINFVLFIHLLFPFLILILATCFFSYFLWRKAKKVKKTNITLTSPFTLSPALKFAFLFAGVLALAKVAEVYFSSQGIYVISIISGIADVDAITLSLSQLTTGSLLLETARNGIIMAALTNVAVKAGIAYWWGSKDFARIIALCFGGLIVVGILILLFL